MFVQQVGEPKGFVASIASVRLLGPWLIRMLGGHMDRHPLSLTEFSLKLTTFLFASHHRPPLLSLLDDSSHVE